MKPAVLALALLILPASGASPAESDPASLLREAERVLAGAGTAESRLAALGRAAAAQEAALEALRSALRGIPAREAALRTALGPADGARLAAIAGLDRAVRAPRAAWLVHPDGPVAAARGAMLLGAAGAALSRRTAALQAALDDLSALEIERRTAVDLLGRALTATQQTRSAIAQDMAARRRPEPAHGDVLLAAALAENGATLGGLAALVARLVPDAPEAQAERAAFEGAKGRLPLPVVGSVSDEGTSLTVSAPAYALVRAPWLSTVRHAGPVGVLGPVLVLEPAPGILIALHGLAEIARVTGEVVQAGEPLGSLGGPLPASEDFLIDATTSAEAAAEETLYIEIWMDGRVQAAADWFALDRDAQGRLQ